MKTILFLLALAPSLLQAGSFPGAAGSPGSDAISKDSSSFVAWANGNLSPDYGSGVDAVWRTPEKAYGPATDNAFDIVCMGNGGRITMYFPLPIRDGVGADFAVFENAIAPGFLEMAFVEVSSDGVNFFRFSNRSQGTTPFGSFPTTMDPTTFSGLAGKYVKGFGTPFDLANLGDILLLDRENIRFVRLIDIIGDGNTKDSTGAAIYDPTPTTGSGGFDLDAIGVIHQNTAPAKVLRAEMLGGLYRLGWESNPGTRYRIETSVEIDVWTEVQTLFGNETSHYTELSLPVSGSEKQLWRIIANDHSGPQVSADRTGPKISVAKNFKKTTEQKSITLKGKAQDVNGISKIQYQLNNGVKKTLPGTQSWKLKLNLKKGKNTVILFSYDQLGNMSKKVITLIRKS